MENRISFGLSVDKMMQKRKKLVETLIGFLKGLYGLWLKFGKFLGHINSRIVLGVIYLILFSPIGIALRLFGRSFLKLGFDSDLESYKIKSSENNLVQRMEGPY